MKAMYPGHCPICKLPISVGQEITGGRWKRKVKEQYNYVALRTVGGYTKTYKVAHSRCVERGNDA